MFFGKISKADQSVAELGADVRAVEVDEFEFVSGGAGGSNNNSSTYSGGSDGYGGSRRNP